MSDRVPVRAGLVSSARIIEAEEQLAQAIGDARDSLVRAVELVVRIRNTGMWREHTIPDPKDASQRLPRFRDFWNEYMRWLLDERLFVPHTSLGWWKNVVRSIDNFAPLGYSTAIIVNANPSVRLALERVCLFERKTRRLIGLQAGINRDLLPVIVGNDNPTDVELARELIDQSLTDPDWRGILAWLRDILGQQRIFFVEDDDGRLYALVFDPRQDQPAVQKYYFKDMAAWPDWLQKHYRSLLGIKLERDLLADQEMRRMIAGG